jgi:hypothetical protein
MRRLAASIALLVCSTLVVAVPSSAQAATGLTVTSRTVAVETVSGKRVVYVAAKCTGSKTCTGSALLEGSAGGSRSYSIKGGKSGYLTVPAGTYDPDGVVGGSTGSTISATLVVTPKGKSAARRAMTLEKRIYSRRIQGEVRGPVTSRVKNLEVSIWSVSGLRSTRNRTFDVGSDRRFDVGSSKLGRNNAPGAPYRLSISAQVDGTEREWFWRGSTSGSGFADGGGGWIRDASVVRAQKAGNFQADFAYGTISGRLTGSGAGADVRVLTPPPSYPSRTSDRRGLDVPYCANEFGRTTADGDGDWSVTFVPRSDAFRARHMIDFEPAGAQRGAVIIAGNKVVDSCQAAIGYDRNMSRLLGFAAGSDQLNLGSVSTAADQKSLLVNGTTVKGGTVHDRWVTLREYSPGRKILESPIVAEGYANTSGNKTFAARPGKYWVEIGRRTSCSAWYPSIYPNNNLYLKGGERGNERWKTVAGRKPEYSTSYRYGYVDRTPPKGYKGWMYRDVCKAVGAGKYGLYTVSGDREVKLTNAKGGTISGRVTRIGGKSNKEMLVTAYSTDGKKVLRSAYTSRSGSFVIRGLATGTYRILVNGDSWRGITRTFDGKKTVKVSVGRGSSAGTLRFRG